MLDRDDDLRAAFADLERRTLPHARLAEPRVLHTVARHRIRRRMAATASGVALAVLVPAVMAAVVLRQSAPPPAYPPATSPAVRPSPTAGPTQPPGQSMRILGPLQPPTGLDDALLDVPGFGLAGCPVGPTQFRAGAWFGEPVGADFIPSVTIQAVVDGDVTGDGAPDLVAHLICGVNHDTAEQVVAYARRVDGALDLIGPVAGVSGSEHLRALEVAADGGVHMLHVATPEVEPPSSAAQWRLRWQSGSFQPTGDPIGIELDRGPTRYVVSVATTALTAESSSVRSATMTVTVTNKGALASTSVELVIFAEGAVTWVFDHVGTPLVRSDGPGGNRNWFVLIEPVLPGAAVTGRFTIQVAGDDLVGLGRSVPMSVMVDGRDAADFAQTAEPGYEHFRGAAFGLLNPS